MLDSVVTLTDDNVFKDLIHWNRSVITTQLTQPGQVLHYASRAMTKYMITLNWSQCGNISYATAVA